MVVTRDGWMKRLGEVKDPSATRVREGDVAKWILRGNTRDNVALFSNLGFVYVVKAGSVTATSGYGEPVQSVLNFRDGERIVVATLVPATTPETAETSPQAQSSLSFMRGDAGRPESRSQRWLIASAGGMGFFCQPDLSETTKSGRRIARVKENDQVITAYAGEGDTITAVSKAGKVLVFPAEELPDLAGAGRGVILMRVDKGDRVVGVLTHPRERVPIAVAEDGSERRFHSPPLAHRAQKGRKVLKRFKIAELIART